MVHGQLDVNLALSRFTVDTNLFPTQITKFGALAQFSNEQCT